jgi:hypothetical protein
MANPLTYAVPVPRYIIAATVALTAFLLVLQWKLEANNDHLRTTITRTQLSLLPRTGAAVPPLEGLDLAGSPVHLDYATETRPTVLLVFSTECTLCDANWTYWQATTSRIDPKKFRLAYVNTSGVVPSTYPLNHPFADGAPVIAGLDPATASAYNTRVSPLVILVSPDGVIRKVWPGSGSKVRSDLEATLLQTDTKTLASR